ncbi:MAG: protease-like activity factor CPAF [Elusimicrobia bacterium]|nr:protease-like activity factor CPAF [Elusimicrobiota bacterium]
MSWPPVLGICVILAGPAPSSAQTPTSAGRLSLSGRWAPSRMTGRPAAPAMVTPAVPLIGPMNLGTVTGALPSLPGIRLAPSAVEGGGAVEHGSPAPPPSTALTAQAPSGEDSKSGLAGKVERMTEEVDATLKAAGPTEKQSGEESRGMADSVFRTLTGEAMALGSMRAEDAGAQANLTQRKMIGTLYKVASIFSEHYAPVEWKKARFQLDLKREYEKAAAVILSEPDIGTRRFQSLVADLAFAMRDYHVTVTFHSTEKARLPLLVMGAESKHFIAYINREKLPKETFPFNEGDEVLEFDGKPTAEAVRALARVHAGNTAETDMRLAEVTLTHRSRSMGEEVPQGAVTLKVRDRRGKVYDVKTEWDYTPEKVPVDVPVRDAGLDLPEDAGGRQAQAWDGGAARGAAGGLSLAGLMSRLYTRAAHPLSSVFAQMRAAAPENPHFPGSKKGFLPPLGPIVWKAKGADPFDAYVYKDKRGRDIAHVRIPDFDGGEDEAHAFGLLMNRFQRDPEIKGLVIDQTNNPGGNLFQVYALASRLTDKPLTAPRHRIIIDESDAAWALELLEKLSDPEKLEAELEEMAESDEWSGYAVTDRFIELIARFARFILSELGAGRRLTGPTHLWGVDDIQPAPAKERFTKPILILVNEMDFSGADFFPAILQDNGRATVMGVRTSGAGGAVKPFEVPNQFGIADLAATWTLALRKDGRPLENLGVRPDVPYSLTERDLRAGFAPYRRAISQAMDKLL